MKINFNLLLAWVLGPTGMKPVSLYQPPPPGKEWYGIPVFLDDSLPPGTGVLRPKVHAVMVETSDGRWAVAPRDVPDSEIPLCDTRKPPGEDQP